MAVQDMTQAITEIDSEKVAGWIDQATQFGVDFGMKLLAALAIYFIGKWIVAMITRGLRKVMQKNDVDKTLETFVCNLVRMALLVVVIIAAIGALGVETTSFIAIMGAAGLAVGLALQGSLSNFAAGVLIILFRPYKVGDFVEAAGVSGSIEEVQILTTIMKTPDNKRIIIPNSEIMSSIITNYSHNATRRVDMTFGIGYGDDIDKARSDLQSLIDADERIHKEPAPMIVVSELADSSVNFAVRVWTDTSDYWGVFFDMTENVKKRFDESGISIPFPQQDVHIYNENRD